MSVWMEQSEPDEDRGEWESIEEAERREEAENGPWDA